MWIKKRRDKFFVKKETFRKKITIKLFKNISDFYNK